MPVAQYAVEHGAHDGPCLLGVYPSLTERFEVCMVMARS